MRYGLGLLVALSLGVAATTATAQATAYDWIYRHGKTFGLLDGDTKWLAGLLVSEIMKSDVDASGTIEQRDRDLYRQAKRAQLRAEADARLRKFDLDGDGIVTRVEAEQHALMQVSGFRARSGQTSPLADDRHAQEDIRRIVSGVMAADRDQDGRLSAEETLKAVQQEAETAWEQLLSKGLDDQAPIPVFQSEPIARKDAEAFVRLWLTSVDRDSNGKIDIDEYIAIARAMNDGPAVRSLEVEARRRKQK